MEPVWGPNKDDVVPAVIATVTLDKIGPLMRDLARASAAVGRPLQALRADRVLSRHHLLMAKTHAERARRDGRARSADPGLELVLYAAADRQIHRALGALGVPLGVPVRILVVALGPADEGRLAALLGVHARVRGVPWDGSVAPEALVWWRQRLGLDDAAPPDVVEEALFGAMAALAVQRL